MNKKLRKLVYELTANSRMTTKMLSKRVGISQQSASYQLKQLKARSIVLGFSTVVDAVKLGFTNVLVGFNYRSFDPRAKKEALDVLSAEPAVIAIQEFNQGIDLLVEYSANNLSLFNKIHTEVVQRCSATLEVRFLLPVIVKHRYPRKYLSAARPGDDEIVICGDRKVIKLSPKELLVLQTLVRFPDATFTMMAETTGLSVKSVIDIKKKLERQLIIRGYTCILGYKELAINRSFVFLRLSGQGLGEMNRLLEYAKLNREITDLIKIIGKYQVILGIETLERGDLIRQIRSEFPVEDYLVTNVDAVIKEGFLPLIEPD